MNFDELEGMVVTGDNHGAADWTEKALADGADPMDIINKSLVTGMAEIGRRWKAGEIHIPEVLIAARAMKASMALVRPLVASAGTEMRGKVVIGTVKGDLHDIGKNLVAMMLEGAGFEVFDLGTDVSPDAFVKAVEEMKPDVLAMSALLTTTVPMMQQTITQLNESELRQTVHVIVGGAPVTDGFAVQIGADGYAEDGSTAVEVAAKLITAT